jgi:hypothetical protein
MPVTTDFTNAVRDKNVRRVRIMMKDSLIRDPSFAEFEEMSREAEKGLGTRTLYDRHDGENFSLNKSDWNKTYMNNQLVDLMSNFSRERLNHLKTVCSFIYADEIQNMKQRNREEQHYDDNRAHGNNSGCATVLLIAAVIVILVFIWLL